MSNERVIESWSDPEYASSWRVKDGLAGLLRLPWRMTGALLELQGPPAICVDLGSGPGTFLDELLTRFPDARGVWVDASPAMLEPARANLAGHGDRVDFVVGDISQLDQLDLPGGVDVVTNSRVAHHFNPEGGLLDFYRKAAALLRPGGWLVTLDHIRPTDDWDERLRAVLPEFAGSNAGKPTHPHYFPYPTVFEHFEAMRGAGLIEIEMPWRAFYTCLFMGRAASER